MTVTRRPKSESESESGIVVEGVVERGASDQFFVDEGYRDFADLYRPLKDYGLQGVAPMHAYLDLVSESPNAAIIHGRIMAGVGRMALSGRPRQFFPTAENFLKKKLYMDDWAPEEPVGASKGPRSAYEEMKEMGI